MARGVDEPIAEAMGYVYLIYLDYNATTPVDPAVLEEMLPWFHRAVLERSVIPFRRARRAPRWRHPRRPAQIVGADPQEIVFTSGATEADNLALTGVFNSSDPGRRRVIVGSTEHPAVWSRPMASEPRGTGLTGPVDRDGVIDPQALSELLDESVALVSVMLANNETGVIAPIEKLADEVHRSARSFTRMRRKPWEEFLLTFGR